MPGGIYCGGGGTNLLDDVNGDGVNNLVDYAIGGADNLLVLASDGSYLLYVYVQWDATNATIKTGTVPSDDPQRFLRLQAEGL